MKVHICLMSDQLLANYLPAKQLKPDAVLLVNTKYVLDKKLDRRIKTLLELQGIKVTSFSTLAPDENYVQLLEFFDELKTYLQAQPWTDITLNITGGTKLMSLAAYQSLREHCQQIIYVNTQKEQIQLFQRNEFIKLESQLIGVDEYLFVHGVHANEQDVVNEGWLKVANSRRLLTEQFVKFANHPDNEWFIGSLNFQASNAVKRIRLSNGSYVSKLQEPTRKFKAVTYPASQLLQACQDYGLLSYNGKKEITIASIEAAHYLSGIWLEEYCYFLGKELGIHDVRCSQPIIWEEGSSKKKPVDNEVDVLFVPNNRMLIIECKTASLDSNVSDSNEIIYKLDSIASDFRGLYGNIWLLSARQIKDERILNRAKSQKINVIHGAQLVNLEDEIKKWAKMA